jgi:outer membrane protein TolC
MISRVLLGIAAFILVSASHPSEARADSLTLNQYLDQVKSQSPGYQSSQNAQEGASMSANEGDLVTMPRLSLQASHLNDRREVAGFLSGSKTIADNFTLGIEKLWDFGLKSKLSYTLLSNNTFSVPAGFNPDFFRYVQGSTMLELEQSLWRNFFGKETRAQADLAEAASLQVHFLERLNSKRVLAQAESAYFRLAIARESVRLQQEVVDRSKKILDWSTKRVRDHLSDKSDMLQARAAYQLRLIEFENVKNEEQAANLSFNALRNSTQAEVPETLSKINIPELLKLKAPERTAKPDEVAAAEQAERVALANQETSLQRVQPDLALFGNLGVNGVDRYLSPAISESFTFDHPMYLAGIRFSMPLYFWETSEIRAGRVKQQLAAEANTRQKRLESDSAWLDLNRKLTESGKRLAQAEELVQAQKEKLDHEKSRFTLGRTTTYQVLIFEQDYQLALLTRNRVEQELVNTYAQLKIQAESN